jgi:hypothetical protein
MSRSIEVPDKINGLFEAVGAILLLLNCRQIYVDKELKGMSVVPFLFYTSWGFWNLYFYPSVEAYWSFAGGFFVVLVNAVYCGMIFYYRRAK